MKLKRYEQAGAVFSESLSSLSDIRKKASIIGNPTIVNSPYGNAMNFVRADVEYINLGRQKEIEFTNTDAFSVVAWFKHSGDTPNYDCIIGYYDAPLYWSLNFDNTGKLNARIGEGGGGSYQSILSSEKYNDGIWHCVVWTFNGDKAQNLYIDNVNVGSTSTAPDNFYSTVNRVIGASKTASVQHFFNGSIKDLIIFDRVLTTTEIDNIYKNKSFDYEKSVISEWDLSSI